jgi:DNA-binding NtrC family response regulator
MPDATGTHILVVHDERIIADTLCIILNMSGFHAQAAYSGEQALNAAMMLKPDVLISDVIMGGISGIELALRVTSYLPGCRIILFSGHAATVNLLHNMEAQGHHFEMLAKPLHPRVLLERLISWKADGIASSLPGALAVACH